MKEDMAPILYIKVISKHKYKKKNKNVKKTFKCLVDH